MKVGVPRRAPTASAASRSCPRSSSAFGAKGVEVVVEAGAGEQALIPDALYTDAGRDASATRGAPTWWSRSAPPSAEEIGRLQRGGTLVGFLAPRTQPETLQALAQARA